VRVVRPRAEGVHWQTGGVPVAPLTGPLRISLFRVPAADGLVAGTVTVLSLPERLVA